MRFSASLLAFAIGAMGVSGADAPKLKELSPVKVPEAKATDPLPVEVNKYRWFAVENYDGPVTWHVDGASVGMKETTKPVDLFGIVSGQTDPGEYPIPAGALIVWGKAQGVTKAVAWGVVDGKAKQLLSLSFLVGPAPPVTPVDPVTPVQPPAPVVVKEARVIFIKESGVTLNGPQSGIPSAKILRDYLTAKTTPEGGFAGWREYDPQQVPTNEQPAMVKLWAAVKPSLKATDPPCVAVEVNGKAEIIPYEKDPAAMLAKLQTYLGK